MDIYLYNSLSKKLELFVPLVANEVSLYVCGPTVYDDVHIGNLRPVIVFDTLSRFFKSQGYKVTYVSNYTDVDDKIINKAIEEEVDEETLTKKYIAAFEKNLELINSLVPDVTPKATDYIPQMISFIKDLVDNDKAYVVENEVFFAVENDKDYGKLSGMKLDQLQMGARIGENEKKRNSADFLLWKNTDLGIKWGSPWGFGRPGWHTECVVMINSVFKKTKIDIHGGGFDLKFPHHENEIAQSHAHNHSDLANYWMHNGFININNEKMSKSLGNVIKAKDILSKVEGPVLRLMILSTHYRAPVNFNDEAIESSRAEITRIKRAYKQLYIHLISNDLLTNDGQYVNIEEFYQELANDLNTPNAITKLFSTVNEVNRALRVKEKDKNHLNNLYLTLKEMLNVLGLKISLPSINKDDIILISKYNEAKVNKDFSTSDLLRDILIKKDIL